MSTTLSSYHPLGLGLLGLYLLSAVVLYVRLAIVEWANYKVKAIRLTDSFLGCILCLLMPLVPLFNTALAIMAIMALVIPDE